MDRNCVVEAVKYFYQFKKVKENQTNRTLSAPIMRGQLKEQLEATKGGEPFYTSWMAIDMLHGLHNV
ncbi:unnamed protein product [Malus baccata var. baccata]